MSTAMPRRSRNTKAIREKGVKLKSVTILDPDAPPAEENRAAVEESIPSGDYILDHPIHDTGNKWLSILSLLPADPRL